jgi:hypothetical protein
MHLPAVGEAQHEAVVRVRPGGALLNAELAGHAQMCQHVPAAVEFHDNVLGAASQPANDAAAQGACERGR